MDKTIVVIPGRLLEDASWMCHVKGEAERLAKWLVDNGMSATAMTVDQWNKAAQAEKDEAD